MKHHHTIDCYARNATGPLAYTPCRKDGLDKNLKNLKVVDFDGVRGLRGLTLVCVEEELTSELGSTMHLNKRAKGST